ncbi:MAG: TonB-dependent receptor, partial [Porphyromonadaceae bacterium]|nr:TonB-dependent receptor [Porphyromonadaceae bacterium]
MLTKNKKQLLVFPLFALGFIAMPMSLHAEEQDSIQTNPIEQVVIRSYVPQRPTAPSIGQPAALTWITSRDLSQYRMQSITDLTGRVPSLFVPDYGSKRSAAIYLRGSGARSSGQTIGLYVDGVPVLNKSGFNFDIPGITGVEVLRGPQGTLYGRNAMSGIINYYTRSAFDQPGGEAKLTAGSHRLLRGSVEQAFRLSDKLGLSYGLSGTTRRGYFYNETRQAYQDSLRMVGGFAKLEYRPTEQLEMALSLSGDYVQQGGFPYRTDDPRTKQPLPLSADAPETYERHTASLRYLLGYKWGRVQLQSATSYQYLFDETHMDMDALPVSYFYVTQRMREHGVTQEFILKNLREGSARRRYDWSLGLFGYYDAKHVEAPVTFTHAAMSALLGPQLAAAHRRNPRIPQMSYYDPERADKHNANTFEMPDWGVALYHESALHLDKNWTLTAGLRLDYEQHQIDYHSVGYPLGVQIAIPGGTPQTITTPAVTLKGTQRVDYWHLLPKLALSYRPSERVHAYATVSRGVKTGGFNEQSFSDLITTAQQQALRGQQVDPALIPSATTYKPEHSWSYELGARYALPSAGLELSSSVYLMQVRDLQLTRFVASGAGRMVGNAGSSRTLGFELSATQRLWSSLRAHLNYSLTDARFTEETTAAKKGNFVPFIPRHTYSVMLSANEPLSRHLRLLGEVEYAGLGEIYWREDNTTRESLQSTLRARLGLSYDRYTLALWGANLTDNSYTVFQ